MKYLQKKIILISVFFITLSCSDSNDGYTPYFQKQNGLNFNKKFKLQENGSIKISLDSISSFNNFVSLRNSIIDNGTEYISFLNHYDNSIKYYSLDERDSIRTIKLAIEGPNGIGKLNPSGTHQFITEDSICVYNESNGKLFFVNNEGVLSKSKDVSFYEKKTDQTAFPAVFAPDNMIKANNNIIMSCFVNGQVTSDDNTILRYNYIDDTLEYSMKYPSLYTEAFWAAMYKYVPSLAFNKQKSQLAVLYPVNPFINLVDINSGKSLKEVYVGSKHLDKAILPFSYDPSEKSNQNRDWARENEFSGTNSNYYCIIYDNYRNLYYIVVAIRPTLEERNRTGKYAPDYSIIICDDQLNKVGETEIFNTSIYSMSHITVVKSGLAIAREDLYNQDENYLTYSLFSIENNE